MKPTVRFLRHGGVYRPMCCLFESLTRSAAFRSGPGQTFRTHRKLLRPAHRRDEPRPAIPQRVARQHCPPPLHRHAHPKTVPGSATMNLQRTVNSVLTVCLSPGDHPSAPPRVGIEPMQAVRIVYEATPRVKCYRAKVKATSALSAPAPVATTTNCRPERVR